MTRQRRKSWVKLWITGWLHGSIRWQLDSEERGVWADLLALGGECGQDGSISDRDGRALPRKFIANQLNISQTLLDRVIAKCIHEGRLIQENQNGMEGDGKLILVNWEHYQSEYDRQKAWRQGQKVGQAQGTGAVLLDPENLTGKEKEDYERFLKARADRERMEKKKRDK